MKNIKICKEDIYDMIWMSARYCIGRHTAAASMHAYTIASLINKNPDLLTKDEKDKLVSLIRDEIRCVCKWNPRFKIQDDRSGDLQNDVFSKILLKSTDTTYPNEVVYIVNTDDIIIESIDDKLKKTSARFDKDYYDLISWIKLANWLDSDNYIRVYCKDANKNIESSFICYKYPAYFQGEYSEVYAVIDKVNELRHQSYIIPECIVKIESINK